MLMKICGLLCSSSCSNYVLIPFGDFAFLHYLTHNFYTYSRVFKGFSAGRHIHKYNKCIFLRDCTDMGIGNPLELSDWNVSKVKILTRNIDPFSISPKAKLLLSPVHSFASELSYWRLYLEVGISDSKSSWRIFFKKSLKSSHSA